MNTDQVRREQPSWSSSHQHLRHSQYNIGRRETRPTGGKSLLKICDDKFGMYS